MDTNEIVKALRKEVAANPCVGLCSTCNIAECMTKLLIQAADLIEKQERQIQTLKWERDVAVEQAAMEIQELQNSLAVLGQANAALREKVPEWIPVKERPPEIGVRVLILDKWGHIRDRVYKSYTNGKPYFYPDGLEPGRDVRAWMPVPEEDEHGEIRKS